MFEFIYNEENLKAINEYVEKHDSPPNVCIIREQWDKLLHKLDPRVVLHVYPEYLAQVPELLHKFAGITIRGPINTDPDLPNNRIRILLGFSEEIRKKIHVNGVFVNYSHMLAAVNRELNARICINKHFKTGPELRGLHIRNLNCNDGSDVADLFRLVDRIDVLTVRCEHVRHIPETLVVISLEIIGVLDGVRVECQNVANNPNIQTLVSDCELIADFTNNTTLIAYEGDQTRIAKIVERNREMIDSQ